MNNYYSMSLFVFVNSIAVVHGIECLFYFVGNLPTLLVPHMWPCMTVHLPSFLHFLFN